MGQWIDVEVGVIDQADITVTESGRGIRIGAKHLYNLMPRESFAKCESGGIIVTHPEWAPRWIRIEDGRVEVTELTLADGEVKHES